jgi:hypothetical protein
LFKRSRPVVRKHTAVDNGFLWAAYLRGSFQLPPGLDQAEFIVQIGRLLGAYEILLIIEDANKQFNSGRGPVAIAGIHTDGWTYVPNVMFFAWATPANKLRSSVELLHHLKSSKEVGSCQITVPETQPAPANKPLAFGNKTMARFAKYGVLFCRGRIPKGSPAGAVLVFSVAGKKAA